MSEPILPRELALRVGLAAQALPGVTPAALLDLLDEVVGLPLTFAKLDDLGPKVFRRACNDALRAPAPEAVEIALSLLKGGVGDPTPRSDAYVDGDMPGSLRVACASNGGEILDGHFGSCRRFLIYQVGVDEVRLVDVRDAEPEVLADETLDRHAHRAAIIADCQIVYVVSIGGPPAAKVIRAGVHPIKRPDGGTARAVVAELQAVLAGKPPPWLAKALGGAEARRAP